MKWASRAVSLEPLYWYTAFFGMAGSLWMLFVQGWRPGLAFALGALVSLGNLWLFAWLARAIEPGEHVRKPWQASTFAGRYLLLLAAGYVIVNALGVSPLPVVLGLFVSTAAVLLSSILELAGGLFGQRGA